MYYKKDLNLFHRRRLHLSRLQLPRQRPSSVENSASTWRTFWQKTTIHGVRNTSDPTMQFFERIIWIFIVFVFTSSSLYCFIYYLSDYNAQVTRTVIEDSEYNVFEFSFPSIVLCSRNRLNWKKIDKVVQKYIPKASSEAKTTFKDFFGLFDGIRFGLFDNLKSLKGLDMKLIKNVHVSSVLVDLSISCEELLVKNTCFWRSVEFNCCDMFYEEKTEAGVCLVFNSLFSKQSADLLKNDRYYPYANARSGEGSGVKVVLKIDSKNKRVNNTDPDGVWMMIKSPLEWSNHIFFIRGETDTSVIITPEVLRSEDSIRDVPVNQRKCIFTSEAKLSFYKLENGEEYKRRNCESQCHQWYLTRYCNCTISLFFPQKTSKFRECTPEDYICIYNNREVLSNDFQPNEHKFIKSSYEGMLCPCMRNCDSVNYQPSFNSLPLQNILKINSSKKYIFLDIYYFSDSVMKYQTYLHVRAVDFLSNVGGLISLFMGASLTSFTEATYYTIYAFIQFLRPKVQVQRRIRQSQENNTNEPKY